jgi:hypothetical protein
MTGTSDPYRNFRTKPGTVFSNAGARANYTNRNFQCLTGTSGEYLDFRTETGTVFSNAGASDQNFRCSTPELSVHVSLAY